MTPKNKAVIETRDRLFLLRVSLGIEDDDEWNRGIMKAHEELQHYPDLNWDMILRVIVPIFADRRP
jgi:hypothetical protein